MTLTTPQRVPVRYEVATTRDDWTLSEQLMPESQPHDLTLDILKALLLEWVARTGLDAQIVRNLAIRWDASKPSIGVDPDLAVISPHAPEGDELDSLCTWRKGHHAPLVGIEVVSADNPRKDYEVAPDKYAASGTRELWVFDPKSPGPRDAAGPSGFSCGGVTRTVAFRESTRAKAP